MRRCDIGHGNRINENRFPAQHLLNQLTEEKPTSGIQLLLKHCQWVGWILKIESFLIGVL